MRIFSNSEVVVLSKYVTKQRKVLLDYLEKHADELLSVQELAEVLEQEAISRSSVYRNLAEMETEGAVRRKYSGAGREILYQYVGAKACKGSLHLSCKQCGRTFHMTTSGAEQLLRDVANTEGFAVDKRDTVLYGICEDCRK